MFAPPPHYLLKEKPALTRVKNEAFIVVILVKNDRLKTLTLFLTGAREENIDPTDF